jgi:catalase
METGKAAGKGALGAGAALVLIVAGIMVARGELWGAQQGGKDLAQQIFEVMIKAPGVKPGYRLVHAKGIVCEGTYTPSGDAGTFSRASHFHGAAVRVTVRFSDGAADPAIADSSPDAQPRGMGIEFKLPSGRTTDIAAISHNGFVVGTGEDFLGLVKAIEATNPSKPHPWPVEAFLGSHPRALKFVQDPKPTPESFATEAFYGNNAFVFVSPFGKKQTGRYFIVPLAGQHYLDDAAAKAKTPNFLAEELRLRLKKGPVKFQLLVQLAEPGDPTEDGSVLWPESRRKVDMGVITIASVVADSAAAEKDLMFDPANLTDGIELSDDPLPALRSEVYMLSFMNRTE